MPRAAKVATRTPPPLPEWLVRNRNFVFLWMAYGIAAIGDHLSEMALLQERGGLQRPDATRIQALISFGFFLPFVVLGPLAGWWSDRFSRRTTMIVADSLRALIVFNLYFIVSTLEYWLEPPGAKTPTGDFAIIIPLMMVGTLAAFFSPARQAMLPTLILDHQLVRANAMIAALGTIGGISGGVIGGLIVDYGGPHALHYNYRINTITFVLSAVFVSLIAMSRARHVDHPPLSGIWTPLRDGFRYVGQHRRVLQLILIGTVFWAAAGVVISVVPGIVRDVFGGSISDVAIYRGLLVVGLAAGSAVMSIVGQTLPLKLAILMGLFFGGFWVLGLDGIYGLTYLFTPAAAAAASAAAEPHQSALVWRVLTGLCLFGMGGSGAALLVSVTASIQRFVPDSRRGRVFGVTDMGTMGAMVAATGLLGLPEIPNLDDYIPLLLAITGAGLWIALLLAWRDYRKGQPFSAGLSFMLLIVQFYSGFWCRLKRVGVCTIPRRGAVIVASNHTAGIDPILILATSRRVISFLVERKYYEKPLAGFFMRLVGCIPVDRAKPGSGFLRETLEKLHAGATVGIFPQGTYIDPAEGEPDARPGIGRIALRTGATVIPVHISGTTFSASPLRSYARRHDVRIRYGPPVDLSDLAARSRDRSAADEATRRIMEHIEALSPQSG